MAGEDEDAVSPAAARQLALIAAAMGGGLSLMAGLVFWSYLSAGAKTPSVVDVKMVNALTTVMMVLAAILIVASEFLWRFLLRRGKGSLSSRVTAAYIVRLGLREGAGLLGMTVAYLAALNGVLSAYPAYWANLAPFVLFLGFLATHWPSADKLAAEFREVVGSNPPYLKK